MLKHGFVSFAIMLCAVIANGQSGQDSGAVIAPNPDSSHPVIKKNEKAASFPGGQAGWQKFLEKYINPLAPVEMNAPAGKYVVTVKFSVSATGKVSQVESETSHGYGMERQVIMVMKKGPNWEPATIDGLPVVSFMRQSVTFFVPEK